jgi:hypothetical protein
MPITFNCPCGKTLRVNDGLGGKQARCPECQALVTIPAVDAGFELIEDRAPPGPKLAKPVLAKPVAKPPAPPVEPEFEDVDDGDDKPIRMKKADARRSDDDYLEERRKARRRDRRGRDDDDYEDEDEYDRAARRRVMGGGRRRDRGRWHSARVGTLIGGVICLVLFSVWVLVWYNSDSPRANGRVIGGIVAIVFSLVAIGRAMIGSVGEDE